eukprot:GHVU01035232.1.p1 GENE.GHVU01035232.1~~GHVU01035232.1.p1  ORF type:complete len:147 (-),score=10.66 GHVU01035232.1:849-1289(-)
MQWRFSYNYDDATRIGVSRVFFRLSRSRTPQAVDTVAYGAPTNPRRGLLHPPPGTCQRMLSSTHIAFYRRGGMGPSPETLAQQRDCCAPKQVDSTNSKLHHSLRIPIDIREQHRWVFIGGSTGSAQMNRWHADDPIQKDALCGRFV